MFTWTLKNIDTGEVQILEKDPRGWEDMILKHERGEKWHGVFYDFTNEFGFYCKGAGKELIDEAYDSKGQEANMRLILQVECDGILTQLFTGKLNFSKYRQEWQSGVLYSWLEVEKDDMKKLINVREDMEVDLLSNQSLSGVSLSSYPFLGYDLTMHSKTVHIESEWDALEHNCCFRFVTNGLKELYVLPELDLVNGDFESSNEQAARCEFDSVFNGFLEDAESIINTSNNEILVQPNIVRITWNIAGQMTFTTFDVSVPDSVCTDATCGTNTQVQKLYDTVNPVLRVFFGQGDTAEAAADCGGSPISQDGIRFIDVVTIPQFSGTSNPLTKNFANTGTRDIILNPGDKVWFYWVIDLNFLSANGDMTINFDYSAFDLTVESDTTFATTPCKAIAIHEAWSRLSEIITDQQLAFYSEFFGRTNSNITYNSDGCGSRTAITSGKNIRQIDAPIKPSLKSMFEACNAVWAIGIGIEPYQGFDVIRAEPVHFFYQTTEILNLVNVPNIKMSHVESQVYNQIALGFRKWQTEKVNGLDEPLTKIEYVVPNIKNSKNKYESISPFVAGMYAIELTRRTVEETKDTGYDEDTFFICLSNTDLTVPEKNENFSSVTGLLSPETAYNLRLMMSSTFDRVKYLFTSGLTKLGTFASPVIMPAEMEGNESVVYSYTPDGCDGDHFGTLQTNSRAGRYPHAQARRENPLWLPEEYTFDYPVEFSQYLNLVNNPYGLIRFSDGQGNNYSGWIKSLEYNVRNKMASFIIIRKYG